VTGTLSLQLYLKCHAHNPKSKTGRLAATMFRESIGEWCSCAQGSVSSSDTIRSLLSHLGHSQSSEEEGDADDKNSNDVEHSDKVNNNTHGCSRDRSLGSDMVAVASGNMVCGVGFGGGVSHSVWWWILIAWWTFGGNNTGFDGGSHVVVAAGSMADFE